MTIGKQLHRHPKPPLDDVLDRRGLNAKLLCRTPRHVPEPHTTPPSRAASFAARFVLVLAIQPCPHRQGSLPPEIVSGCGSKLSSDAPHRHPRLDGHVIEELTEPLARYIEQVAQTGRGDVAAVEKSFEEEEAGSEFFAREWQVAHHSLGDEDRYLLDNHLLLDLPKPGKTTGYAHAIHADLGSHAIDEAEPLISRALVRHRTARGETQERPVRRPSSVGEPPLSQCPPDCPRGGADLRSVS